MDITLKYDLVYALHLLLFPALLMKGLKYGQAISMSLSSFEPIEQFPPPSLWPHFDILGAISDEIIHNYIHQFRQDGNRLTLIPNHIPLEFIALADRKKTWQSQPHKVAVVSNHEVEELTSLKDIAPFKIDYYGTPYSNAVLITPEILLNYDVVISIGKTIQYCMGLGIPVFEYDHFGGCGYITLENFREEGKTNFSGRGSRRKLDAGLLLDELVKDYPLACAQAPGLRKIALQIYGIDKIIEKQLMALNSKNIPRPKLNVEAKLFCNAAFAAMSYILKSRHKHSFPV